MAPGPGDQLGHYRLDRLLGSGGMGEVYLAHDLLLQRPVAIKFVSDHDAPDPGLARRLMKEARAVAAIDHPNICPVHDAGTDSFGRPYIVMQYVEGETLSARLVHGPLPVDDALTMCAEVAEALAAAHRWGIDRDLKPSNILIALDGRPKVLDFGIAKFLPSSQFMAPEAETQTTLTQPHAFIGTPGYMSPEQVHRAPLDSRSDLFALGAVLYECLTGRRAFQGTQVIEILSQVRMQVLPQGGFAPTNGGKSIEHGEKQKGYIKSLVVSTDGKNSLTCTLSGYDTDLYVNVCSPWEKARCGQ